MVSFLFHNINGVSQLINLHDVTDNVHVAEVTTTQQPTAPVLVEVEWNLIGGHIYTLRIDPILTGRVDSASVSSGYYDSDVTMNDDINVTNAMYPYGMPTTSWYAFTDITTVSGVDPIAEAGEDQTAHVGVPTALDGSASFDPDEHYPLTYAWQIIDKPLGSLASLDASDIVNPWFTPDILGDYTIQLTVTDASGAVSRVDTLSVNSYNTAPVADAGADQQPISLNSVIELGTDPSGQSYDVDGDTLSYFWQITRKPTGSAATLSDPFSGTPTFQADLYGSYQVDLVVSDLWSVSAPDSVIVSFENVAPIAVASASQSRQVSDEIFLDGSGSSDANGDPLTCHWSFTAKPEGSAAEMEDSDAMTTRFVADLPGTYAVTLSVSDGLLSSDPPATVAIYIVSLPDIITEGLQEAIEVVNQILPESFKNKRLARPLTNKFNAITEMIDLGYYEIALLKLRIDVLKKIDGYAVNGKADKNDWIISEADQQGLYGMTATVIKNLEDLLGL